jgi:hypothetical protein
MNPHHSLSERSELSGRYTDNGITIVVETFHPEARMIGGWK